MSVSFGKSILFLCPHPDDEVVAAFAAVGRAKAQGSKVAVLFLTHGCLDAQTVWPWSRAGHAAIVARRRAEAEREVRAAIAAHAIDQVWTPAYEGGNPDHDGANAIASRLAAEGMNVLEFAEYSLAGGKARSHRFPLLNGAEEVLPLTAAERTAKRHALALYASEKANLDYVGTEREVLRPLAAYDYARPPHEGKLFYARFQWVPFRHPRVDFTQPVEVTQAISNYLGLGNSGVKL